MEQKRKLARIGEYGVQILEKQEGLFRGKLFASDIELFTFTLDKARGVKIEEQEVADKVISAVIRTLHDEFKQAFRKNGKTKLFVQEATMLKLEEILDQLLIWQELYDKAQDIDFEENDLMAILRLDKAENPTYSALESKTVVLKVKKPFPESNAQKIKQIKEQNVIDEYYVSGDGLLYATFAFEMKIGDYVQFIEEAK